MVDSIPNDILVNIYTDKKVLFAKNSHRPQNEVQEIILSKGGKRTDEKLKCTYIEIDESPKEINTVILSKPIWSWGAEMGSNNKDVSVGNIVLKSSYNAGEADSSVKRLLGMDLVRLALERGSSAEECVDVIGELLEKYGQGGPYSEDGTEIGYQCCFVVVDQNGAWVLDSCGPYWATRKITNLAHIRGYTVGAEMDKTSANLKEKMVELKLWDGTGEFNFSKCFSVGTCGSSSRICDDLRRSKVIDGYESVKQVMRILRSCELRYPIDTVYPVQSSQVSILSGGFPSVHWFTGTPDPDTSVYKPFIFTPKVQLSCHICGSFDNPSHTLYELHCKAPIDEDVLGLLRGMENLMVDEMVETVQMVGRGVELSEFDELMKDCVEAEVKLMR